MVSTLRQRHPIDVVLTDPLDSSSPSSTDSPNRSLPTFTPPQFTVKDLLGAIPAHCFERSALHSSLYVVGDFALVGAAAYAASFIDGSFGASGNVLQGTLGVVAKWAAWSAYWVAAGLFATGIWILGHECGHQAFSTSKQINNGVGLVLHSLLLVPYHSWRISHGRHHAATGHMARDEVFVPKTRSMLVKNGGTGRKVKIEGVDFDELLEDAPIWTLQHTLLQQLFGWPAYLFTNASGQKSYPKWTNHFNPSAIIFDKRHRHQVIISDIALSVVLAGLSFISRQYGFSTLVKFYLIPYLFVNHWLVMITYLQHTDPNLPHYRAGEWTFPRGALCTVDRNLLGPIGPYILHGICETHIAHHIASKIPHYNAWEATEALKAMLGEHYSWSDENMFVSLWKNQKTCRFVEDEGEVLFFKDAYGRAQREVAFAGLPSDSGVEVGDS